MLKYINKLIYKTQRYGRIKNKTKEAIKIIKK